jgi:hypothetical protein
VIGSNQTLGDTARLGSGLDTVYQALDHLVALYGLDDAAVVVDVPGFGRQVLRAGRRPLGDDPTGLHRAEPGLYLQPPLDDPVLGELVVAIGALGLRYDGRFEVSRTPDPSVELTAKVAAANVGPKKSSKEKAP